MDAVTTAPALSVEDVATLNAARKILKRLSTLHFATGSGYAEGMVAATAGNADHAVFQVLNFADTYLRLGLTQDQLYEDGR